MTIFVTGGCKNGKSTYALDQAARLGDHRPRYYIATLAPQDDEQWQCVRRHREAREGLDFLTVECPRFLLSSLENTDRNGVFLLDSVTALLTNEMFLADGTMNPAAVNRIIRDLDAFLTAVRHAVIVSDYIYSDGMDYTRTTRAFGKALARIDCFLAQRCDCVVEVCGGIPIIHKNHIDMK